MKKNEHKSLKELSAKKKIKIFFSLDDCLHAFFFCTDHVSYWPQNEKYCREVFSVCEKTIPFPLDGRYKDVTTTSGSTSESSTMPMTSGTPTPSTIPTTTASSTSGTSITTTTATTSMKSSTSSESPTTEVIQRKLNIFPNSLEKYKDAISCSILNFSYSLSKCCNIL